MSNYNRITFKERVRIEAGVYAEKSFSRIAGELGRSRTYVSARLNGKQPWTVPDAIAMQRLFGWSAEETLKYTYGG